MSFNSFAVMRRGMRAALISLLLLIGLVVALSWQSAAHADTPYPPVAPSNGVSGVVVHRTPTTVTTDPSHGVDAVTVHRSSGTASTGFETLTATGIAIALLVGGGLLLVVSRRRSKHA